jgi:hypothetical protein
MTCSYSTVQRKLYIFFEWDSSKFRECSSEKRDAKPCEGRYRDLSFVMRNDSLEKFVYCYHNIVLFCIGAWEYCSVVLRFSIVVTYSKASVTFFPFACQLFDTVLKCKSTGWNMCFCLFVCLFVCLFLMAGCGKHVKWEKLRCYGMRIF